MKIIKSLVLLLGLSVSQAQAATISFDQSRVNVLLGDVFTMDIIGTEFLDSADGGGINLSFESDVLNVLSVSIDGVVWDFDGYGRSEGIIDNALGTLDGVMVNTFGDPGTSFTVATIEFEAIGLGSSDLILTEFSLNPWSSGGLRVNPDYQIATVTTVPIPMAVWLFGSGLICLVGFARRKKA